MSKAILDDFKISEDDVEKLYMHGGSSGGSLSKINALIDGELWIVKLPSSGDGNDAASEQMIRIALRVRKQYLPGLSITFVEIGCGGENNIAKHFASRQDIMYLE